MSSLKTVQQHILDEERRYPGASGDFTSLLTSLIVAAKIISRDVNRAGLARTILGATDSVNVYGEIVMKLDEFAQDTVYRAMGDCGMLCVMASEESAGIIAFTRWQSERRLCPAVRPARRLLEHRREHQHRYDFLDSPEDYFG